VMDHLNNLDADFQYEFWSGTTIFHPINFVKLETRMKKRMKANGDEEETAASKIEQVREDNGLIRMRVKR
jgi:hypothetical protein